MAESIILSNEYLSIFSYPDGVYITTHQKGYSLEEMNILLANHPEINITQFSTLKNSIDQAPKSAEKIGVLKDRILIQTENNDLKATIVFNLSKDELSMGNRENIMREAISKLKELGIVYGIHSELFSQELTSGTVYVIAQGLPAIDGTDSIIKLYTLLESTPDIRDDGKADFYDLKLINLADSGAWLGERLDATEGTEGKTIKGTIIKQIKGKNFPLAYDRNTVSEVKEDSKTILYSKIKGAISFKDGKIMISNHLDVPGNVDFSTGNINFDGYVTIKGTIADGFSVMATQDIEVNGEFGLGHVKEIISTHGSIFIKGGIAAKGAVEVRASNDIYAKFIENVHITCGGTVHVGFYCINSNIKAKEVIIDSLKGQIIGGYIEAEVKVLAPIIGSEIEKKTIIEVTGFDREKMKVELEAIFHKISELKIEQQKIKTQLSVLEQKAPLDVFLQKEYNTLFERIYTIKDEIKSLENNRKNTADYLKAKGEGEITVTKKVYPHCVLSIKKNLIEIAPETLAVSFFIQDGQLKQVN